MASAEYTTSGVGNTEKDFINEKAAGSTVLTTTDDERDTVDPFVIEHGKEDENINYRTMGWVKAGALIMAEVRNCVFWLV